MREEVLGRVQSLIFSGRDPMEIANDITDYILSMNEKKGLTAEFMNKVTHFVNNEWMNLYPTGVRSGGKLLRSDKIECIKKMAKFMKDYPEYTPDIILAATRKYLAERERNDYEKTICATYFIHRQGVGSELAAACAELLALREAGKEREIPVNKEVVKEFFL